jgi:hypothetical protein
LQYISSSSLALYVADYYKFYILQAEQLAEAGLTASHIAATAMTLLGQKKDMQAVLSNGL